MSAIRPFFFWLILHICVFVANIEHYKWTSDNDIISKNIPRCWAIGLFFSYLSIFSSYFSSFLNISLYGNAKILLVLFLFTFTVANKSFAYYLNPIIGLICSLVAITEGIVLNLILGEISIVSGILFIPMLAVIIIVQFGYNLYFYMKKPVVNNSFSFEFIEKSEESFEF